ncbi:hypothetical protein GOBAR_DD05607 [Gossypium barbadense]|nr:hypothetical protein GOBAR_DD05607 [Gossypium barbadense]
MAAPTSSNLKCFKFIFIAIFCCNVNSGNSQNFPAQSLAKAFFCFNNKYIYTGCDEAYRLNESGNLNVPREATDIFCNGPCFAETQIVLKCVDNILSDFIFYNKATIGDVTNVLHAGCSYTNRRDMKIACDMPSPQIQFQDMIMTSYPTTTKIRLRRLILYTGGLLFFLLWCIHHSSSMMVSLGDIWFQIFFLLWSAYIDPISTDTLPFHFCSFLSLLASGVGRLESKQRAIYATMDGWMDRMECGVVVVYRSRRDQ